MTTTLSRSPLAAAREWLADRMPANAYFGATKVADLDDNGVWTAIQKLYLGGQAAFLDTLKK